MKVRIEFSIDVAVSDAPRQTVRAVEVSLAQFGEQLEAVIDQKLRAQFPDVELSFGAVEEGR